MSLRIIKILMLFMVGLFCLIGAVFNLTSMEADLALVSLVVIGDGATGVADWQKIETPWFVTLCWAVIPLSKALAGLLCLMSVGRMWSLRRSDSSSFQWAKHAGIVGCGVMLAMLFGVFILIAETWFQQWQTPLGAGILGAAQRYIVCIGVIVFFVYLSDDELAERGN
ncbi:DUF2165 family protein [Congregibacter variabilis]|uniref:DUF2165 family protein n=1 Tax=Congregibacter variabilis TaxID=3081200 RepID=A0ABZ0HZ04_9GAMM|nr:DUF2165 family protein [Congregibacter sp. IMCC43200]